MKRLEQGLEIFFPDSNYNQIFFRQYKTREDAQQTVHLHGFFLEIKRWNSDNNQALF